MKKFLLPLLIVVCCLFTFTFHITLPAKKLTLESAIEQGIPLLGMTSLDVVKALGEPTKVSDRKDGVYGMYYAKVKTPLWDEPLEHVYLLFIKGRLAEIRKGEA